jgi:hypothetical protein
MSRGDRIGITHEREAWAEDVRWHAADRGETGEIEWPQHWTRSTLRRA